MKKKSRCKKNRICRTKKNENPVIGKKDFLKRVYQFMKTLGIGHLYAKIPLEQKRRMAKYRMRSFRIEPEQGTQMDKKYLHYLRSTVSSYLKEMGNFLGDSTALVSLHDYFTVGYTCLFFFNTIKPDAFEGADELCEATKKLQHLMEDRENPFEFDLASLLRTLAFFSSRPDRLLCTIRTGTIDSFVNGHFVGMSSCAYVKKEKPKTRHITVDGIKRVVFRVGVPDKMSSTIKWIQVPCKKLSSDYSNNEKILDMYIQSHAMHRFLERTRGLDLPEGLRAALNISLKYPTIVEYRNNRGLLAFTLKNGRLGYFIFTIIDNMLIIKTFLFLTSSGTPEGRKLDRILGIRKIDKKYLSLDSAYAFMHTDILNSPWLCDILVQAGCGQLCDIVAERMEYKINRKVGYALDTARYLGLPETVYSEAG